MCHQQFLHAQTDKDAFKFRGESIQLHLKTGAPDSLSRAGLTKTRGNKYWLLKIINKCWIHTGYKNFITEYVKSIFGVYFAEIGISGSFCFVFSFSYFCCSACFSQANLINYENTEESLLFMISVAFVFRNSTEHESIFPRIFTQKKKN